MNGNELRAAFLAFMEDRGHAIVSSAPLVPDNDPTTLFTGSGMQPMLPYLLGQTHHLGRRIANSQRCFRMQDIEEVGDNRHTTAFEMLGNWSLGDYFKHEQLRWIWTFLTREVGLDKNHLYISVFAGDGALPRDEEAITIWQDILDAEGLPTKVVDESWQNGMSGGRIFAYPSSKNWWSRFGPPEKMPLLEPGGPDSELFYEFTGVEHDPAFGAHCHPNCDCGRFLEIGNSVFMQFQKQGDGAFAPLTHQNIDFGGGLERVLAAARDEPDVFRCDLFWPIIQRIEAVTGQSYAGDRQVAFRVISDHIKAAVWLLADGVSPSNKTQGYVLRRLIRRAARYGRMLGTTQPFTATVAQAVQDIYSSVHPAVGAQTVLAALEEEERRFLLTLDRGLNELKKLIDGLDRAIRPELDWVAEHAFDFYQTLGLPVDIFIDDLIQRGGFVYTPEERQQIQEQAQQRFARHQELSRSGSGQLFKGGLAGDSRREVEYHTVTHILQQALRDVLGAHVQQRGSNITPDRLRFDFTHDSRLSADEKRQVEQIVNQKVEEDLIVSFALLPLDEARTSGAIGLFDDKYGHLVKVYSIGGRLESRQQLLDGEYAGQLDELEPREAVYSREFCGGPHIAHTGAIRGQFGITKDEKIARDVVRLRGVLS